MLPDPSTARDPVEFARISNERRKAMRWISAQAAALPRVAIDLTEWFDWDKCRINVYHLVEPRLVKWT